MCGFGCIHENDRSRDRFIPALWWRFVPGAYFGGGHFSPRATSPGWIPSRRTWRTRTRRPMRHGAASVPDRDRMGVRRTLACRSGLRTGQSVGPLTMVPSGNYWQGEFPYENTLADGWERTSPVGLVSAQCRGLFDMIGNVWEWTGDIWSLPGRHEATSPACCSATSTSGESVMVIKEAPTCARGTTASDFVLPRGIRNRSVIPNSATSVFASCRCGRRNSTPRARSPDWPAGEHLSIASAPRRVDAAESSLSKVVARMTSGYESEVRRTSAGNDVLEHGRLRNMSVEE